MYSYGCAYWKGALTGMDTQCKALTFRKRVFIEKKKVKFMYKPNGPSGWDSSPVIVA